MFSFFSHFEHVGDAGGFDGDLPRLLHSLFPPSTEQICRVDLFIICDGTWESGFAHVRVLDEIVVPDLDGDGFRRESAIEDEFLVESRIEIVFDGFRAHGFTAANQSLFAFHDAIRIGSTNSILWKERRYVIQKMKV